MSVSYTPTYTVSGKAMQLMVDIAAALERYKIILEGPDGVRLRKINHIRTIRGTTAIEGNTLTEDQITAILAGKRVSGTKREIDEVKGAHNAYQAIERYNPYLPKDLLAAHGLMTESLVDTPGRWRTCEVGVMGRNGQVAHMAPPARRVPQLMKDLFAWLNETDAPALIKSCVFHFEFEFIHPFPDGNGRTGRLWQTAILGAWRNEFYGVPIENIVWAHQQDYYKALQKASATGDAGVFIDFMLDKILRTLKAKGRAYENGREKGGQKSNQKSDQKILAILERLATATIAEMMDATGLSQSGVKKVIRNLKAAGRLRRIGPDKGGRWEVISPARRKESR